MPPKSIAAIIVAAAAIAGPLGSEAEVVRVPPVLLAEASPRFPIATLAGIWCFSEAGKQISKARYDVIGGDRLKFTNLEHVVADLRGNVIEYEIRIVDTTRFSVHPTSDLHTRYEIEMANADAFRISSSAPAFEFTARRCP